MKKTILLSSILVVGLTSLQAQTNSTRTNAVGAGEQSIQLRQTNQYPSQIEEPSGAESSPQGRAFSTNNPPPGRAFSTNNPPEGRPFQNDSRPPGRPFRDPAGSEQDSTNSDTQPDTSATNSVSKAGILRTPAGAPTATQTGSTAEASASVKTEAAGAQRKESQQLVTAFTSNEKVKIEQAINTSINTSVKTKVPSEFVTRLSSDLTTVFTKVQITEVQRVELADAIYVILNAAPGQEVAVQEAFTTVHTTLIQDGAAATPLAHAAVCDLHLIATQLMPGFELKLPTTAVHVK